MYFYTVKAFVISYDLAYLVPTVLSARDYETTVRTPGHIEDEAVVSLPLQHTFSLDSNLYVTLI